MHAAKTYLDVTVTTIYLYAEISRLRASLREETLEDRCQEPEARIELLCGLFITRCFCVQHAISDLSTLVHELAGVRESAAHAKRDELKYAAAALCAW